MAVALNSVYVRAPARRGRNGLKTCFVSVVCKRMYRKRAELVELVDDEDDGGEKEGRVVG